MKILFTGASSFTGYWFAKQLVSAGHDVHALFRRTPEGYPDPLRRRRVSELTKLCEPVFDVSFGDDDFIKLIKEYSWDLLCHHGAETGDYKSPHFNVMAAVESNTHRLPLVIDALKDAGCRKIVVTGSVFECDEGAGARTLEAFSPYGLSKALTWQCFRYYAQSSQFGLGKFVIPNPFGPYEEPRFTYYLVKSWFAGLTPAVNTPSYVRDNIHVSLLARSYARFITTMTDGVSQINPSGYIESQGAFALRFATEMRQRLNLKCELALKTQTDFSEPQIRINTDRPDTQALGWIEKTAWDELAEYYATLLKGIS